MKERVEIAIEELLSKDFGESGIDRIVNMCSRHIFTRVEEVVGSQEAMAQLQSIYHKNIVIPDLDSSEDQEWYIESAILTTPFVKTLKEYRKALKKALVENLITEYDAEFANSNYGVSLAYLRDVIGIYLNVKPQKSRREKSDEMKRVSAELIEKFREELQCLELNSESMREANRLVMSMAMAETYGSLSEASRILGISRDSARFRLMSSVSDWRKEYLNGQNGKKRS